MISRKPKNGAKFSGYISVNPHKKCEHPIAYLTNPESTKYIEKKRWKDLGAIP
jgi:hypothetical protein